MTSFRVPQRRVEARIRLGDGRQLQGTLFTAEAGPGGAPGRLADRLNDAQERFFPFVADGVGRLLNKSGVVLVVLGAGAGEAELPAEVADREVAVRLTLRSGEEIQGHLPYTMPPERGRLLDYLNSASRFVPIRVGEELCLVNLRYVVDLQEETPAG